MLNPPMRELLDKIENRYLLVNVVAKRAREIAETAQTRGDFLEEKPIKTALMEIRYGRVCVKQKGGRTPGSPGRGEEANAVQTGAGEKFSGENPGEAAP